MKVAGGRRAGGLGEKAEGVKTHRLAATKWSWDAKYSTENLVSTIVIAVRGASWA